MSISYSRLRNEICRHEVRGWGLLEIQVSNETFGSSTGRQKSGRWDIHQPEKAGMMLKAFNEARGQARMSSGMAVQAHNQVEFTRANAKAARAAETPMNQCLPS